MAISIDAVSDSNVRTAVSSFNWTHTVSSGSDRFLVVGVIQRDGSLADIGATGITANGDAMSSLIAREGSFHAGNFGAELWGIVAPDVGTYSIAVTLPGTSDHAAAFAISMFGAEQSLTMDDTETGLVDNFGISDPSISMTATLNGGIAIDALYNAVANSFLDVGSGQTVISEQFNMNGGGDSGAGSYKLLPASGSTSMFWTSDPAELDAWVQAGIIIKPSVAATSLVDTISGGMIPFPR